MDSGTVGCSGRSDFSLLVNVAQYVGREGSQVTPPSSYNINHLKGGAGLPLRGGNSIMVWAFCHAPLLINSERIFVLNLFRVICGHLKVHGRTLFVIIQFLFPFAKSYLDGLVSVCLSLEGMLVWVSVGAVSQDVPLGIRNTEWDCTIEGQSPKQLRTDPRPPSIFGILILVTMATLNS